VVLPRPLRGMGLGRGVCAAVWCGVFKPAPPVRDSLEGHKRRRGGCRGAARGGAPQCCAPSQPVCRPAPPYSGSAARPWPGPSPGTGNGGVGSPPR
jgi:hypothetical protein